MTDGAFLFRYADDGSLPLRPGQTAREVLAERRDLELHEYYEEIWQHSFETTFVPVDVQTAEAWRISNRGGEMTAEQQRRMDALRAEVGRHIREMCDPGPGEEPSGAFVRLSTRSPKDAIDASPQLRARAATLLRERLRASATGSGDAVAGDASDARNNAQLVEVQAVTSELLSVRSAEEAFELLAMSSRCVSDLVRLLDHRNDLPSWDLHLIVRRFVPLPPVSEFRCFVHERRLTAISQYFASCHFAQLPAARERLQRRIAAFVAARIPEISLASYIIDVAALEPEADVPDDAAAAGGGMGEQDGGGGGGGGAPRTYVIELNPFAPTTGACLFDWEADAELLRGGGGSDGPVELRLVEAPEKHLDTFLMPWQAMLREAEAPAPQVITSGGRCAVQ